MHVIKHAGIEMLNYNTAYLEGFNLYYFVIVITVIKKLQAIIFAEDTVDTVVSHVKVQSI